MRQDGGPPDNSWNTSNRAKSRKTRVYAFRDFLMETYGDYLQKPSATVLDVAGGKGDLSWLMMNVDGISESIVLDPVGSVPKCSIEKSVKYLRDHPEECTRRSVPGLPTYQPLAALMPKLEGKEDFRMPRHLKLCLDAEFVERIRNVVEKRDNAKEEWEEFWERKVKGQKGTVKMSNQHPASAVVATADTAITDAESALEAFFNTTLVVGFHPDQATDYCIELASLVGVPWCIVPCCVFPAEFPHRRLKTGERVRDYRQLVKYLQEQHPEAKTAYLNFHFTETAKNLVLYTTGTESD